MEHKETGLQAPPEAPRLCANNCGFFGSPATMNLCSKCHRDMLLKQQQSELAASSFGSIVNGNSGDCGKELAACFDLQDGTGGSAMISNQVSFTPALDRASEQTIQETTKTNRCSTCQKRVGLTGFNCKCGNLFCSAHRYSEKHDCPYDYRSAARAVIAKANPLVKADKLDKI